MEKSGIIHHSNSPWISPLHIVKKKDGRWGLFGDYLCLNTVTVTDHYSLPNISDFTSRILGSTVFSKLDLHKGYYQVPMNKDDIQVTDIVTLFGMFEFLRLPFGLRNAGNTFQRTMDQILGDPPLGFVYIDDIQIYSPDIDTHVQHLHQVFKQLCLYGLTISLPKCVFPVSELEFTQPLQL